MLSLFLSALLIPAAASAGAAEDGLAAINKLTGCYLVDYSYTETESLKKGYERDSRVYDVNKDKAVKEWIYTIPTGENKVRLQHILFVTDLDGTVIEEAMLRHQAEDWEFNAPFLYDFTGPATWNVKPLEANGNWTRRITNLDDGLRYQCSAPWTGGAYPEWSCDNYAPIPGRETRDMNRKDYNTLERSTKIVSYGDSWIERQENTKIIHGTDGVKTPLAKEVGKNWFVRLPDSQCAAAQGFQSRHQDFWDVMRAAWEDVLVGDRPFIERVTLGPARYMKMMGLNEEFPDLTSPEQRAALKAEMLKIIGDFRVN